MKQFLPLLVATCGWLSALPVAQAQQPLTATLDAPSPTLPGAAVFKLKPGANIRQLEAALNQVQATGLQQKFPRAVPPSPEKPGSVELRTIYRFSYPAEAAFGKVRQTLLGTGAVEYVEPLYQRQPLYQPNDPAADSTVAGGQFYLKSVRAYAGWDISKGDSSVVIGITDTGTRFTHQELRGQEKRNYADPINGLDDDNDGFVDNFRGWDTGDNDNNPTTASGGSNGHGVLVAGCTSARPDNGKGIAGVGFNCRYLPIKIYATTPGGAFGGFEGIVYAADHGCRIINASWGGVGGKSQFEQDAVSYAAINRDAVVVVAAGNTNAELDFYPASYDNVVSVAALEPNDAKGASNTYSYHVDLSAPGQQILTTTFNNDSSYAAVGGSSFAAPIVAAAAGLVRSKYPQLSGAQVAALLRQTTDDIYSVPGNAAYLGRLGTGRLNIKRALALAPTAQAVSVRSQLSVAQLVPASSATLTLTVQNLLQPVQGLMLTVTSLTPELVVAGGSPATVGNLATNATASVPLQLSVSGTAAPNARGVLRCRFTAPNGFQDDQYVVLELNPDYVVLTANDLHLTVTSRGNLGYEGLNADIGRSVSYRNSPPLLSEGGLLVATNATHVADRLRGTPNSRSDQDFFSQQPIRFLPSVGNAQQARGTFQDSLPSLSRNRGIGVRVRQRALAWAAPAADRDYAIVEYTLRNLTPDTLKPLHAGLFMDWDVPAEAGRNVAAWDSVRALGYVYDVLRPSLYTGVKLIQRPALAASYYALENNALVTAPVALRDGFSTAEKFLTLSSGTRQRTAGGTAGSDVSHVVGAALKRLAPNDSVTVAFAVLAAPTLAQLQAAADAAQIRYLQVLPNRAATAQAAGWQVYPNPASAFVRVTAPTTGAAPMQLRLLDLAGRTVRTWSWAGTAPAMELDVRGVANGLYVLQMEGATGSIGTQKLALQL
ncbi:S8 family serine peptidase [Hymenobacter busanensis]|uniref:S8 family serine peptidase n=1 Tax=Hymenobacter busanensis TaxID=2607656 RepID=A0A7L5A035_9BACT|nr:S8 family serine peptidase [Hymenobacter busanensis]KAA9339148.1 S8 family serine peptidase [Hymenobacter busanensis]QHJ07090.1 S8 family serine peptidase [Hymenobacter busanensis]